MGWVRIEVIHWPSPAWEKAVVMPQVGHGLSNQTTQVHFCMPSCVWVACPAGFGESHAAVMRMARVARARMAAAMRSPVEDRRGVVRSVG